MNSQRRFRTIGSPLYPNFRKLNTQMTSLFLRIKRDTHQHGQEEGFNNKENRGHSTKSKRKINIIGNSKSLDKCFREPENKEEGKKLEPNQVKAKVKATQEIKVFRPINLPKKAIRTVKELLQSKVSHKVKNALVKKTRISPRNNLAKNRQARKDRTKIWEKHIQMNQIDTI